jgi:hypothetical protein
MQRLDIPVNVRDGDWVTPPPCIPLDALANAAQSGLDIAAPCVAQRYNAAVAEHGRLGPIETFGHTKTSALLIGNTRALWPALKRAVAAEPERLSSDPVDRHVEATISALQTAIPEQTRVYFGHTLGPDMVSMLHAAKASGLADLGPAHLAVHPAHGPWFALRALIVIDHPAEAEATPPPDLCSACAAPCISALAEAVRDTESRPPGAGLGPNWRAWVTIRDVCPVGQGARYTDAQVRYHYALDDSGLRSDSPARQT